MASNITNSTALAMECLTKLLEASEHNDKWNPISGGYTFLIDVSSIVFALSIFFIGFAFATVQTKYQNKGIMRLPKSKREEAMVTLMESHIGTVKLSDIESQSS